MLTFIDYKKEYTYSKYKKPCLKFKKSRYLLGSCFNAMALPIITNKRMLLGHDGNGSLFLKLSEQGNKITISASYGQSGCHSQITEISKHVELKDRYYIIETEQEGIYELEPTEDSKPFII